MVKTSGIGLKEREAIFCYGMSRMSVINEMAKGPNLYHKMVFVEFLEYIGRVADLKYRDDMDLLLY